MSQCQLIILSSENVTKTSIKFFVDLNVQTNFLTCMFSGRFSVIEKVLFL